MPSVDILQQCNGACRALLVKEPWASQLVTGKKTMELRSTRCSFRENVAIARIGTSQIIGTRRIVDCKLVALAIWRRLQNVPLIFTSSSS